MRVPVYAVILITAIVFGAGLILGSHFIPSKNILELVKSDLAGQDVVINLVRERIVLYALIDLQESLIDDYEKMIKEYSRTLNNLVEEY